MERETGLSKDTLRVWERRYGFPAPERDSNGERLYPPAQVQRLVRIKRLIERGHRPGKLLALDDEALDALDALDVARIERAATPDHAELDTWLHLVRTHDSETLQRQFHRELARHGVARFVQDIVAPTITRIGEAWSRNEIGVFEEHLFSEQLERLFRATLANLPPVAGTPRVLLTTLSGEEHTLGLLMVEALLTVEDAYPVVLGAQTPIAEIVRAAGAKDVDVVCLSFSSAYSPSAAARGLSDLRRALPARHALWAGGQGVKPIRTAIEGVALLPEFQDLFECLAAWKRERAER